MEKRGKETPIGYPVPIMVINPLTGKNLRTAREGGWTVVWGGFSRKGWNGILSIHRNFPSRLHRRSRPLGVRVTTGGASRAAASWATALALPPEWITTKSQEPQAPTENVHGERVRVAMVAFPFGPPP